MLLAGASRRARPKHLKPQRSRLHAIQLQSVARRLRPSMAPLRTTIWRQMMQSAKQKASPATRSNGVDAIELLKEDHRTVEKIFKEFEKLQEDDADDESKRAL